MKEGGFYQENEVKKKKQICPELEINEAVVAPIVSNSTTSLLFINFYLRPIKILMQIFKDFKKNEFVLFDLKALRKSNILWLISVHFTGLSSIDETSETTVRNSFCLVFLYTLFPAILNLFLSLLNYLSCFPEKTK